MNEAYIKECIARELSREMRIQNALTRAIEHEEELRAWWQWWRTSQWIEANGGHEGV